MELENSLEMILVTWICKVCIVLCVHIHLLGLCEEVQ